MTVIDMTLRQVLPEREEAGVPLWRFKKNMVIPQPDSSGASSGNSLRIIGLAHGGCSDQKTHTITPRRIGLVVGSYDH